MKRLSLVVVLGLVLGAGEAPWTYVNDMEKTEVGQTPQDVMIASSNTKFAVKSEGKNKYLEASAFPTDFVGLLYGPERTVAAGARIRSEATGKRYPEFGVAAGGTSGCRVWVVPILKQVQMIVGEQVVARAPFEWKSGSWTQLRVQVREEGGKWVAEAKAWEDGQTEPGWMLKAELKEALTKGKASASGSPYSDKPIDFDDLVAR